MKYLVLAAIYCYQKFISPYKGFSCAYRLTNGGTGCSGYGKKVFKRFGVFIGWKLLQRRFYDCSWNATRIKNQVELYSSSEGSYKIYQSQRGDCDCGGCDLPADGFNLPDFNCDFSSSNGRGCLFDIFDCGSGCDCGNFGNSSKNDEKRNLRNERKLSKKQKDKKEEFSEEDEDEEVSSKEHQDKNDEFTVKL